MEYIWENVCFYMFFFLLFFIKSLYGILFCNLKGIFVYVRVSVKIGLKFRKSIINI